MISRVLLTKHKKLLLWLAVFATTLFVVSGAFKHYAATHPVSNVYGESMTPGIVPNEKILGCTDFGSPERHDIFVIDQTQIEFENVKHANGPYLKRLVGVPGDTLTFQAINGELMSINGVGVKFNPAPEHQSFELTSKSEESLSEKFLSHAYQLSVGTETYPIYQTPISTFDGKGKISLFLNRVFNFPFLKTQPKNSKGQVTVVIPEDFYFALSDNRVVGTDSRQFGLVPLSSLKYKICK